MTKHQKTHDRSGNRFLFIFFALFIFGCEKKDLVWEGSAASISGSLSGFNNSSNLSLSSVSALGCNAPQASLYKVSAAGDRVEPALSTQSLSADGRYSFSIKNLPGLTLVNRKPSDALVVVIQGCASAVYIRPVTGFKDQDVSVGSSMLGYVLNTVQKNKLADAIRNNPSELTELINSISNAASLSDAYAILSTPAVSSKFNTLFGVAPVVLDTASPEVVNLNLPSSALELSALPLSVSVKHWSASYLPVYSWKLDGVDIGQSASITYTPNANSQGTKVISLYIGEDNGSGAVDLAKPYKIFTQNLAVSNNIAPVAPNFSVTVPTITGVTPVNTRNLTLTIATGSSQINCDSFSKLLVTENNSAQPAASDFGSLACTTNVSQNLAYTLFSANDGAKTLRLWALDSSGVVSASASSFTIYLDTGAPATTISTTPLSLSNSTTQSFSFSGNDNGGVIDHYECQLDAAAFAACSSPKSLTGLAQGSHTFSVKAIDTAGNLSSVVSKTWAVDLIAPVLTLSGNPAAITNSLSSTFSFSATDSGGGSVANYDCRINAGSWANCVSPAIEIMGAPGSYTYDIRTIDTVGNISAVTSYSWVIDMSPPTVSISSNPLAITNSTTGTFSFAGSDTGGGTIASYQCKLDAGSFANCTSGQSYSSLTAGAHSFEVKATDTAGNVGASTTYSWTIDLTTPMASINANPAGITNSTSATFQFSANAPGGGSIIGYECAINGSAYTSCSSPKTYTGLVQGNQTFQVKSIDNNNARGAAVSYNWIIDTTLPVLTVATQPAVETNLNSAAFTFSATDSGGATISGYECKLNTGSFASCSSPVNLTGLTQGSYTYQIKALDNAGNYSTVQTINWVIDTTAPTLSINTKPNILVNSQTANFTFTGADTGGSSLAGFECSIDSGSYAACTSPKSYASLAAGTHTFAIRVSDSVGNVSAVTNYNWTIDLDVPTLSITAMPASITNLTTANFSFSGSDTGGGSVDHYECKLDAASYATCTSPQASSSIAQGAHTFYVKAIDTAGNESLISNYAWNIDTTPPTIAITTPATNGTVIPATQVSNFTVGGTCSENTRSVQLSGASTATATCSSGNWSVSIDVSAAADGTLALTATHADVAGNNTASTARTFIKDTVMPVINITTPVAIRGNGAYGNVSWSLSEANVATSTNFTVELYNGTTWVGAGTKAATPGLNTNTSYTQSAFSVPNLDISTARVRVSVTDAAGNVTSTQSGTFIIDSTAPTISAFQLAGGNTTTAMPNVATSLTTADNISGVAKMRFSENSVYADNGWITYNASSNFTLSLTSGAKVAYAWVQDASGNVSASAAANISLDFGNPPVLIVNFPDGNTNYSSGQNIPITWNCTGPNGLSGTPISVGYTSDSGRTVTNISSNLSATSGQDTTYNWTFPSGITGPLQVAVYCQSASGVSVRTLSAVFNSSGWKVFVGGVRPIENANALVTDVSGSASRPMGDSNGNIYFQKGAAIMKIDNQTGLVTRFAGDPYTTGCTISDGSNASAILMNSPQILGWSDTTLTKLLIGQTCTASPKVFALDVGTGMITDWVTLPGACFDSGFNCDTFITKNRYLIYRASGYLKRVFVGSQNQSSINIIGNGSWDMANDKNKINFVPGASSLSGSVNNNEPRFFTNADASKIWLGGWLQTQSIRFDGDIVTGVYTVGSNNAMGGNEGLQPYAMCSVSDFDSSHVYCKNRPLYPAGPYVNSIDVANEKVLAAYRVPYENNSTVGDVVVGFNKNQLVAAFADQIYVASPTNSSTALTLATTTIGGQPSSVFGNGTASLSGVVLAGVRGIRYQASSNKLFTAFGDHFRLIDFTSSPPTTSTVYGTIPGNSNNTKMDLSASAAYSLASCSTKAVQKVAVSSATGGSSPVTMIKGTSVCSGATPAASFPPADNTNFNAQNDYFGGAAAGTLSTSYLHTNGKLYFSAYNAADSASQLILVSDGTTYKYVAGVVGAAPGYNVANSGTFAVGANLSVISAIAEVQAGPYIGDLLIVDNGLIRRISIVSESASPKIYDLYNLAEAAGGTFAASIVEMLYDSSSETAGFGSGNYYFSTINGNVHRWKKLSGVATNYSYNFDSNNMSGNLQISFSPYGLLVTQPAANRILVVPY